MNRRDAIKKAALLLGGAFSAPTLMAMSRWEQAPTTIGGSDFSLTDMQRKIVAEVAEMIIPKTTTSGAKDAGVPAFIEMMIKDCYAKPEHLSFVEGLTALEQDKFLDMDTQARTARLKKLEAETKAAMKAAPKTIPFWRLVKELTLLGYFTSEVGIRDSYEYVQIPTKFEVIKLKPNQKAYAY
jgi:Gluconate 2-dehydrogenase subunit 3